MWLNPDAFNDVRYIESEWLALFKHNIKVTEIYIYKHIHTEHIDDIISLED